MAQEKEVAIIKVGEDGAHITLPNGNVRVVGRKEDSVSASVRILEALNIECRWAEFNTKFEKGL